MKKSATATSDNLRIVRNHFDTNYDPLIASLSVEQPNQFLSFLPWESSAVKMLTPDDHLE
ncbi:hypothetical protein ABG752_07640 [Streptococcus iniae]